MLSLVQDIRYGVRQLVRIPGFTLTAVLSLALGIGATTAVFSVVWGFLVNTYPYAHNDRMVHMRADTGKGQPGSFSPTAAQWQDIRKSPVVEDAFLDEEWNLTITGADLPEDVQADYFSSNAFDYFGVPAALGRGLIPSDAIDGQDPQPVVVLGYKFWQRHFAGDPAIVGKTLQMVHKNYTIVGVAAKRFTWEDADVYLPEKITQDAGKGFYVGIRLKPGVSRAQAEAALDPLLHQFAKQTPNHYPSVPWRLKLRGFNDDFLERLGDIPYLLFGAVATLLLIGCGNVSILLLARASARSQEFAVRSAIGASRSRIVRQLLTESLLISLSGAGIGVAIAYRALDFIVANLPMDAIPHEANVQINLPVLLFSVALAVATGVLFGLWPALEVSKPNVSSLMQTTSRKVAGSVAGRRFHGSLIAGQLALTLLMLASAGAAIEGFLHTLHMKLGYDPHNVMSVGIPIHEGTYQTWATRLAYFDKMRDAAASVPGVTMAAISSNATPPSNGMNINFQVVGQPSVSDQPLRLNLVSREYFPILKIAMGQGRLWEPSEEHNGALLAVVNQAFVRKYFPNGDALGHALRFPELKAAPPYVVTAPGAEGGSVVIVGVIEDKLDDGLANPILPEAFVPYTFGMRMGTQILVRSEGSPLRLLHAVATKINEVDHDQQVYAGSKELESWIEDQPEWARGRLLTWLFGAFAALALVMSAVGLYSVVSYTVVQRTSEFGIRMALGAKRGHVLRIVFQSVLASVVSGLVAGAVLNLALGKLLAHWASQSQQLGMGNPLLLAAASAVLLLVAVLACSIPARRAADTEPIIAIRYE